MHTRIQLCIQTQLGASLVKALQYVGKEEGKRSAWSRMSRAVTGDCWCLSVLRLSLHLSLSSAHALLSVPLAGWKANVVCGRHEIFFLQKRPFACARVFVFILRTASHSHASTVLSVSCASASTSVSSLEDLDRKEEVTEGDGLGEEELRLEHCLPFQ